MTEDMFLIKSYLLEESFYLWKTHHLCRICWLNVKDYIRLTFFQFTNWKDGQNLVTLSAVQKPLKGYISIVTRPPALHKLFLKIVLKNKHDSEN